MNAVAMIVRCHQCQNPEDYGREYIPYPSTPELGPCMNRGLEPLPMIFAPEVSLSRRWSAGPRPMRVGRRGCRLGGRGFGVGRRGRSLAPRLNDQRGFNGMGDMPRPIDDPEFDRDHALLIVRVREDTTHEAIL